MKLKTSRNYSKKTSQTQNEQKLTLVGLITPCLLIHLEKYYVGWGSVFGAL